jgi:bacterial/archaeal transporter family-2 protein
VPASSAFWAILGIVAGALIALQAPVNAQLARAIGSPVVAAAVSFAAGSAALLVVTAVLLASSGAPVTWRGTPLWLFVAGGCLGAFYVTFSIILTPRLGAAALMGLAVTGQLVAGLLLDHYGVLGLATRELSLGRLAGAALLIAGAVLLRIA